MNTKLYITTSLVLLGVLSLAPYATASTFQLSPASVNVNAGNTFTVAVALNPEGVKNYTVKMEANFPADILKVNSFTLANTWMAVGAQSYDLIDNTNGVLIKTAGYPAGVATTTSFGVISFSAKKQGSGKIVINGNSFSFNSAQQNTLQINSTAQVLVAIKPASPVAQPSGAAKTPVNSQNALTPQTTQETETPATLENTPSSQEAVTPSVNPGTADLLSGVVNVLSLGTHQSWLAIIVVLILIGAGLYAINNYQKKKNKQQSK